MRGRTGKRRIEPHVDVGGGRRECGVSGLDAGEDRRSPRAAMLEARGDNVAAL